MKRILLIITAMLAVAGTTSAATDYGFKIAGISVTSSNYNNVTGSNIKKGTVKYDPNTKTVTLNGVTIERTGKDNRAIYNSGCDGLTVMFQGTNTLSATDAAPVRVEKNTTIKCASGGTATITGGKEDVMCPYSGCTLTIEGANLTLTANNSEVFEGGSNPTIIIKNSTITATSKTSYALKDVKSLEIHSSTVTLTSSSSYSVLYNLASFTVGPEMDSDRPAFAFSKQLVDEKGEVKGTVKFTPTAVEINSTNFPDNTFRDYVKTNYDKDKNGFLRKLETNAVNNDMWLDKKGISNLKGIEHFTELRYLYCYDNNIESVDLSKNTNLIGLFIYKNKLTRLDVTKNTALETLQCYSNRIYALDVTKNTNLQELNCYSNNISSLDVTKNTKLTDLQCNNNELKALNTSKNTKLTKLYVYSNSFTEAGLTTLVNNLPTVKSGTLRVWVSSSDKFTNAHATKARSKGWDPVMWVANKFVSWPSGTDINTTNFPDAAFRSYILSNLDPDKDGCLYQAELDNVKSLDVSSKGISNMKGIENFTKLEEFMCLFNNISSLNLSTNTGLKKLNCSGNKLTSLDVTKLTELTELTVSENNLTKLDVTKNTKLVDLRCHINQLSSIDISKNTALTAFSCSNNKISTLSLNNNTLLQKLYCDNNQLEKLDVSKLTKLTWLDCYVNKLTALDVSKNTALTDLNCYDNQLAKLDVSKNTKLTKLYCYLNKIKSADMTALANSLPKVSSGEWRVAYVSDSKEQNTISATDVTTARGKGWKVNKLNEGKLEEYATGTDITSKSFPDSKLLSYVTSELDTDKDGVLTAEEAAKVTSLDLSGKGISNLSGIEIFTSLTKLTVSNNSLSSIDVSKLTKLTELICDHNNLTTLDVSKNTALTKLDCGYNQLTKLDVSKNTKLTTIYLQVNKITDAEMTKFVNSLSKVTKGELRVYRASYSTEKNDFSSINVTAAKGKGWTVNYYTGSKWAAYSGSATAITDITVDQPAYDENAPTYNLKGERVGKDYKGIVIQNGRKFVRK